MVGQADFVSGGLQRQSYARPGKLFTANDTLFSSVAGELQPHLFGHIRHAVVRLVQGDVLS